MGPEKDLELSLGPIATVFRCASFMYSLVLANFGSPGRFGTVWGRKVCRTKIICKIKLNWKKGNGKVYEAKCSYGPEEPLGRIKISKGQL